jgi:hypothetical protein
MARRRRVASGLNFGCVHSCHRGLLACPTLLDILQCLTKLLDVLVAVTALDGATLVVGEEVVDVLDEVVKVLRRAARVAWFSGILV